MTEKLYIILYCLVVIGLLSMSIWGGWAEKAYGKTKYRKNWGWSLRLFGKEDTKEKRINLMKAINAIGVFVMIITLIMLVSLEYVLT